MEKQINHYDYDSLLLRRIKELEKENEILKRRIVELEKDKKVLEYSALWQ